MSNVSDLTSIQYRPDLWTPHVVAATIVEKDGRFLCVEEESEGRLVLNQPAGHLDPGESLIDAAMRETAEETGWTVKIESLLGIYLVETELAGRSFIRFCFIASGMSHDADAPLDDEIRAVHWLSEADLRRERSRHRSPMVMRSVEDYLAGHSYPLELLHVAFNR